MIKWLLHDRGLAEQGGHLSRTQGRSMSTPRTAGPAAAMQLDSISPRPPPTSMMHRADDQS